MKHLLAIAVVFLVAGCVPRVVKPVIPRSVPKVTPIKPIAPVRPIAPVVPTRPAKQPGVLHHLPDLPIDLVQPGDDPNRPPRPPVGPGRPPAVPGRPPAGPGGIRPPGGR